MEFGTGAFTRKRHIAGYLRLFVGCAAVCYVSTLLAFIFPINPSNLVSSELPSAATSIPIAILLGGFAVFWLRFFGFPTLTPLRSRFEQRLVCLGLLWGFLCCYTATIAIVNLVSGTLPSSISALFVAPMGHFFGNCSVLLGMVALCSWSPTVDSFFTRRIRIAANVSHQDFTRLSWHLAKRRLKRDVQLVPIGNRGMWRSHGALSGFDALVIAGDTGSISSATIPPLAALLGGLPVFEIEHFATLISRRIQVARLSTTQLLRIAPKPTVGRLVCETLKRVIEPLLALCLGILLLPVLIILAVAVRLSGPGPIIYRQVRAGWCGKNFTLLKFRTMRVDAENAGPQWSAGNRDPRVTRIGKFLRATRLDELPQLWNVVAGELAFIGPRPERPEMVAKLVENIPAFPVRTATRPGISGWAQVRAGYAASVDESLCKLEYDLYYALFPSFAFDVEILVRTLIVAIAGDRQEVTKDENAVTAEFVKESDARWERGNSLVVGQ